MITNLIFRRKVNDSYEIKNIQVNIPELSEEDKWELLASTQNACQLPSKFFLDKYPGTYKLVRNGGRIWIARRAAKQEIRPDCVLINDMLAKEFWSNPVDTLGPHLKGFDSNKPALFQKWSGIMDKLFKEQQLESLRKI